MVADTEHTLCTSLIHSTRNLLFHLILTISHEVDAPSCREIKMTALGVRYFGSSSVPFDTLLHKLQ